MIHLLLEWRGWAYTKNHKTAYNSRTGRHYKDAAYQAFQDSMIIMFRCQAQGVKFGKFDILVIPHVGPCVDHHNLLEPIMDALQASGVIRNDRDAGWVTLCPPTRHPNGKEDTLKIFLTGEKHEKD